MTDHHTRREFMGRSALGLARVIARPVIGDATAAEMLPTARGSEPDLVVTNAKVYTMDTAVPRPEAFAVKDGRFIAVGSSAAMTALAGKGTQRFDAKQMTILPGFIDTHNHAEGDLLLYEVQSVRSGVRHHREHHRQAPRSRASDTGGHLGGRLVLR